MEIKKEFDSLVETLKKFDGLSVIDTNSTDIPWIHFKSESKNTVVIISSQISDLKDQYACSFVALNGKDDIDEFTYQLLFEGVEPNTAILVLNKKLITIQESTPRGAKMKEFGIPDLSLVTIKQMAMELKQRQDLTFAIIWIENKERDNIAIEGSGNPTQLIGLLARGEHLAIQWADKNIKFHKPPKNEEQDN